MMVESLSNAQRRDNRASKINAPSALQPLANETSKALPQPKTQKKSASSLATLAFSFAVLATLYAAWTVRDEQYIVAGSGIGYWIGVAGSLMMLVLLLYPVRKSYAKVTGWGRIATWFKSHMVMGILGPTLIILHSNFEFKSFNAIVATVVMLTVVSTGIFGRFLYSKVHRGLYGVKAEAKALLSDAEALKQAFGDDMGTPAGTLTELKGYESAVLDSKRGVWASAKLMFELSRKTRSNRKAHLNEMQTGIAAQALRERWDDQVYQHKLTTVRAHLDLYNATIRKAAGLKFYDQLFGWWHVLHMPLFFLLVIVAIVHIIAVHLY
jgi:hypothetical protein